VTLLIGAALGIIFGRWLGISRPVFMTRAFVGASAVDSCHPASLTDRSWSMLRLPSGRLRMAVAAALIVWGVAAGVLAVQSQTVAPTSQTIAPAGSAAGAEFYLKRGEDFSGVHQYDRAIADFTTAIRLKPDYAEAYNDRGFAYYLKGDAERAIADYTRATELRPNYPKAYNSRGVAYMAHGYGAAKSVPDFDRAIALKPDFRYAYINRANARLSSHPWLALQDFHRAGMYPERTVAMLGGAILVMIVGIAWIRRRHIRRASGVA
jgi:Tfp pilus assembly protein PilF